jgi:hypothetical protein
MVDYWRHLPVEKQRVNAGPARQAGLARAWQAGYVFLVFEIIGITSRMIR